MKKTPIFGIMAILLLVFSIFVSGAIVNTGLDMSVTQPSSVDAGTTSNSGSFTVENLNVGDLTNIEFSNTALVSGSNTISASAMSFNPTSIDLNDGATSGDVDVSVIVPASQAPGTYTSQLSAEDGTNTYRTTGNVFTLVVNGFEVQTYNENTPLIVTTQPDDDKDVSFVVKNVGGNTLSGFNFDFVASDFADNDDDAMTLTFESVGTLNAGESKTVNLNVATDNKQDSETYSGIITVTSDGGTYSDTFKLEVRVKPKDVVCKDGLVGDVTITGIDFDEDDFKPGETMTVDVDVDNNADEDLDVTVEVYLYNVNQDNIVADGSFDDEVQEDDDLTFSVELEIPIDNSDLDENDEYILYVKAYEREKDHCDEDSDTLSLDLNKNDVIVDDFSLSPDAVMCGELVSASVDVLNIGSSNEDDVYVQLRNSALGLDKDSNKFDLEKFEDKDNDASVSFSFTVPEDVKEGSYSVETIVVFDDGNEKVSSFATLTVAQCGPVAKDIEMSLVQNTFSVRSGNILSVPINIKNNGDLSEALLVEITPTGSWANKETKLITLSSGESSTIYMELSVNGVAGTYSAEVTVSSNSEEITSETITVNVEGSTSGSGGKITGSTTGSVFDNKDIFWIIGDILLVIVAILFVKMIFFSKKD